MVLFEYGPKLFGIGSCYIRPIESDYYGFPERKLFYITYSTGCVVEGSWRINRVACSTGSATTWQTGGHGR